MRCFYVLVHGRLTWRMEFSSAADDPEVFRPHGFYCHRYVLASCEEAAQDTAFHRVRENLEKQTGWISAGSATLDLEAEDVANAPMHKLLKPDNKGHTFYQED